MTMSPPPPARLAATRSSSSSTLVPDSLPPSYSNITPQEPTIKDARSNTQSTPVFTNSKNFETPISSQPHENCSSCDDKDDKGQQNISETSARSSTDASTYTLQKALPIPEAPYHVFTLAKKKQMVYIVSLAALFSPLSGNIYFPALGAIADVGCSNSPTWSWLM